MQRFWRASKKHLASMGGVAVDSTSHREKLIAALGAVLGIGAVYGMTALWLEASAVVWMLASMGASAVLLFAVPHGALSQPWAVVGGHGISALVGVSCYQLLGNGPGASALSVGLAIAAMGYLRCLHPPGGATALAAVIGGEAITSLGYGYLLMPVGINVVAIMLVAVVFNNLFSWRRYPVSLMRKAYPEPLDYTPELSHEDFAAAMEELDTYVDITSEELAHLFERAWHHARESEREDFVIGRGRYYSNGAAGDHWAVREVFDFADDVDNPKARLIYKVMAGRGVYETGLCRLDEFRLWARFEVTKKGERWIKVASL